MTREEIIQRLRYGVLTAEVLRGAADLIEHQKERAEAAERELADLMCKMREPDDKLLKKMHAAIDGVGHYVIPPWHTMRSAWRAGVNHLLEGK